MQKKPLFLFSLLTAPKIEIKGAGNEKGDARRASRRARTLFLQRTGRCASPFDVVHIFIIFLISLISFSRPSRECKRSELKGRERSAEADQSFVLLANLAQTKNIVWNRANCFVSL